MTPITFHKFLESSRASPIPKSLFSQIFSKMIRKKLKANLTTAVPIRTDNDDSSEVVTSKFFTKPFWEQFYDIECELNGALRGITFERRITHIYNPVEYAEELHCAYLRKFLTGPKRLVFVGMNPGPNGMAQTGVPFGNVQTVRDLMKLQGAVGQPEKLHPKRPVDGLSCPIEEPSGIKFWGFLKEHSTELDIFSQQCFIHNFCPLVFYDEHGHNITPSELKGPSKTTVRDICVEFLVKKLNLLQPEIVVAVGSYVGDCLKRIEKAKTLQNPDTKFLKLPHPSPRSVGNANWPEKAKKFFEENDLLKYVKNES